MLPLRYQSSFRVSSVLDPVYESTGEPSNDLCHQARLFFLPSFEQPSSSPKSFSMPSNKQCWADYSASRLFRRPLSTPWRSFVVSLLSTIESDRSSALSFPVCVPLAFLYFQCEPSVHSDTAECLSCRLSSWSRDKPSCHARQSLTLSFAPLAQIKIVECYRSLTIHTGVSIVEFTSNAITI